jgi:hypothetical protein
VTIYFTGEYGTLGAGSFRIAPRTASAQPTLVPPSLNVPAASAPPSIPRVTPTAAAPQATQVPAGIGNVRARYSSGTLCVNNESDSAVVPTVLLVGEIRTRDGSVLPGGYTDSVGAIRTVGTLRVSYYATAGSLVRAAGSPGDQEPIPAWTTRCYPTDYGRTNPTPGTRAFNITMVEVTDIYVAR